VKKLSSTEITVFVYNGEGTPAAEYSSQTAQTPQVSYLTEDHLGSPRIITNESGAVTSRRDFMPFGKEIYPTKRVQNLGYTSDNIRQKFTSYEHDIESDLEFAQARYYNPTHGRFTSVDPLTASQEKKSADRKSEEKKSTGVQLPRLENARCEMLLRYRSAIRRHSIGTVTS